MTSDRDTRDPELVAFFDGFVGDFASFDGAIIATRYATPYLAIADGSSRLFPDSASIATYFQTVLDGYFDAEVRSCRYHSLEVVPIGSRSVLATVTWEMLRKDGAVQTTWLESYNLERTQAGLRICVSTDHAGERDAGGQA